MGSLLSWGGPCRVLLLFRKRLFITRGHPRAATESLVPCVLPRACRRGTLTRSRVPKAADKRCRLLAVSSEPEVLTMVL